MGLKTWEGKKLIYSSATLATRVAHRECALRPSRHTSARRPFTSLHYNHGRKHPVDTAAWIPHADRGRSFKISGNLQEGRQSGWGKKFWEGKKLIHGSATYATPVAQRQRSLRQSRHTNARRRFTSVANTRWKQRRGYHTLPPHKILQDQR